MLTFFSAVATVLNIFHFLMPLPSAIILKPNKHHFISSKNLKFKKKSSYRSIEVYKEAV
jgi:hypothetical protein